jgi:Polyketide cyclase / dehydrase and lipid transport
MLLLVMSFIALAFSCATGPTQPRPRNLCGTALIASLMLGPGSTKGGGMPHQFSGSAVIDRPIEEVFAFLADGTNDPRFSPRVLEIRKATDGPVGVGTVFESKVKDAGMTTSRRFELTEFAPPTRIRWAERSKNIVTAPGGGYDLEALDGGSTKVTIFNQLEGHGVGKLIVGFANRAAVKDAPALAQRIKAAVEGT